MKRSLIILSLLAAACQAQPDGITESVRIVFCAGQDVRSVNPPEDMLDDVNIFIFGAGGTLEEHIWARGKALEGGSVTVRLIKDMPYSYYICANTGYRMPDMGEEELSRVRYYLTYPDEFGRGIPMSAVCRDVVAGEDGAVVLELSRCMAKCELRIDRSKLYSGVELDVESVEVGACPRSVSLFSESRARSADDLFPRGYSKSGWEASALNVDVSGGMSGSLCLYLLENCQGTLLEGSTGPEDKMFGALDKSGELCSYLEIHASYRSSRYCTKPGEYLVYRFYLGESLDNFDVRRNVNYSIVVRPEGSGLNETSWRVDSSALEKL